MKKIYMGCFVLILAASIAFSTHNTLAENSINTTSSETPAVSTATPAASTSPTATSDAAPATTTTATDPSAADNSTLNLSLEDALKYMETGNSSLQLADAKIAIYEKQAQQALARQGVAKGEAISDEDTKKDAELNYPRAQWTLENAQHDRDTQLKDLKAQITNEYENILALQQQEVNLNKQMTDLDTVISQQNLQIKLGLAIPSSIYSYNAQKTQLEAGLKSLQNSINTSLISLKQDIGIDVNRNVVLTSQPIEYTKFDDSNIDSQISKAIANNYDLKKTKEDIDITQIEYNIDSVYEDTSASDQVELSIEDKKGTLQTLPVTLEVNFKTAYNNLKSLEGTIAADQLTVEADQINLNIAQQKIKAGTMSSLQLMPVQTTLLNDQLQLQKDINSYMLASTNFQNSLDD